HFQLTLTDPSPQLHSFSPCTPTSTTNLHTLSLHDALPILPKARAKKLATSRVTLRQIFEDNFMTGPSSLIRKTAIDRVGNEIILDRKSTRLNSSHVAISYAVFCLKKKNINRTSSVLISFLQ